MREKREYDVEISFGGGEWRETRMSWQLNLGDCKENITQLEGYLSGRV